MIGCLIGQTVGCPTGRTTGHSCIRLFIQSYIYPVSLPYFQNLNRSYHRSYIQISVQINAERKSLVRDFFSMAVSGIKVAASGAHLCNTSDYKDRYLCPRNRSRWLRVACLSVLAAKKESLPFRLRQALLMSVRRRTDLFANWQIASCVFSYPK